MTPTPEPALTESELQAIAGRWLRRADGDIGHPDVRALVAALRAARAERDQARAALRRYTDIVELSAEDYRAKYGRIVDYADAMDDFYQAARAALAAPGERVRQ